VDRRVCDDRDLSHTGASLLYATKLEDTKNRLIAATALLLISWPAFAFDGWRVEAVIPIKSKTSTFDYSATTPERISCSWVIARKACKCSFPVVKTIDGTAARNSKKPAYFLDRMS